MKKKNGPLSFFQPVRFHGNQEILFSAYFAIFGVRKGCIYPRCAAKPLEKNLKDDYFSQKSYSRTVYCYLHISSNICGELARDHHLYLVKHNLPIMKKSHFLRSFFSKMQHKILFILSMLGVQYHYTDI